MTAAHAVLATRREAGAGFRERTQRECIRELEIGAEALGQLAHAWLIASPAPTSLAIAGAEASIEGMRRLVAELRRRVTD